MQLLDLIEFLDAYWELHAKKYTVYRNMPSRYLNSKEIVRRVKRQNLAKVLADSAIYLEIPVAARLDPRIRRYVHS